MIHRWPPWGAILDVMTIDLIGLLSSISDVLRGYWEDALLPIKFETWRGLGERLICRRKNYLCKFHTWIKYPRLLALLSLAFLCGLVTWFSETSAKLKLSQMALRAVFKWKDSHLGECRGRRNILHHFSSFLFIKENKQLNNIFCPVTDFCSHHIENLFPLVRLHLNAFVSQWTKNNVIYVNCTVNCINKRVLRKKKHLRYYTFKFCLYLHPSVTEAFARMEQDSK